VTETDLHEQAIAAFGPSLTELSLDFRPFEIKTLLLTSGPTAN
jgi:hypothetical protein